MTGWRHLRWHEVFTPACTSKVVFMRNSFFGLMLAGALCTAGWITCASAQDTSGGQQESVADAARKARAERKQMPPPAKVWTDDNLPKSPHQTSGAAPSEGEAAATPEAAAAGAGEAKPAAGADDAQKQAELEAQWRKRFADAHRKLDDDQKDLDLMQREYNLKQQQYYSDPNTAMRQQYNNYAGGRGPELNDLNKKIDEKKQQIEQDKQAISDLEDQLRKDGLPAGWSRP